MTERIYVTCPGCSKKIAVPQSAAGRRIKCPGCSSPIPVARRAKEDTAAARSPKQGSKSGTTRQRPKRREAAPKPVEDDWLNDDFDSFSEPTSTSAPLPPKQRKKKKKSTKPKLVGSGNEPPPIVRMAKMSFKERLIHGGGLGGIVLIIGGTIWLVGGLMSGFLFYGAPIMIIAGLFTCIKGLFGDD